MTEILIGRNNNDILRRNSLLPMKKTDVTENRPIRSVFRFLFRVSRILDDKMLRTKAPTRSVPVEEEFGKAVREP